MTTSQKLDEEEMEEIREAFNLFDTDGNGASTAAAAAAAVAAAIVPRRVW